MSWLDQHLEEFVKPRLGKIPNVEKWVADNYTQHVPSLVTIWECLKKTHGGVPLIFPGRDTYLIEILARMEDYPTTFRPEISSSVGGHPSLKGLYVDYYGFDSGYAGSVLKAMGVKKWSLVSGQNQLSCNKPNLCSVMEGAPKYWARGETDSNGSIKQSFVKDETTFSRAAQLTILIAKGAHVVPYAPTKVTVEGGLL